jgi:hypothetical protein
LEGAKSGATTRNACEVLVARWYDAVTGQFSSVDPQLESSRAPYEYAANEPLGRSDPSGALTCTSQGQCNTLISQNYEGLQVNANTGLEYLQSFGFSRVIALGIVGNLIVESTLNPATNIPGCGGLACFVGSRFGPASAVYSLAWFTQVAYETSWTSIYAQYHFIDWELYGFPYLGLGNLERQTTIGGAVSSFQTYFEGGAGYLPRLWAATSVSIYG